jgi:hypothetical protein
MSRRPAHFTQADIARALRAAKQAGAQEVEVRLAQGSAILIRLTASKSLEDALAQAEEIVL